MSVAAPDDELTQTKLLLEDVKTKHDIWKSECLNFEFEYNRARDAFARQIAVCGNELKKAKEENAKLREENENLREELHGSLSEIVDLRRELNCALREMDRLLDKDRKI